MSEEQVTDSVSNTETEDASRASGANSEAYWRRKHDKLERELATIKKGQLSEVDRHRQDAEDLRKERDSYKSRAEQILIRSELKVLASKAGCIDPDAASQLVDLSGVTVDDSDRVIGLEKAFETLRKSKSYLFGRQSSGGGNTAPTPGVGNGSGGDGKSNPNGKFNAMIRERAGY